MTDGMSNILVHKITMPTVEPVDAIDAGSMVLYYNRARGTRALLLTRGSFAITYEMTKSDISGLAAALTRAIEQRDDDL